MNLVKLISRRFVLALVLLCGAGQALAGPIYRVSIDTSTLAGQSGYLDFLMLGLANASPLEASIGNFSGGFAAGTVLAGDAGGSVTAGVTIGNGKAWNEFAQWSDFGGVFSFDLSFIGGDGVGAGTSLGVALLDADFGYLGIPSDIVTFAVQPGQGVAFSTAGGMTTVRILPTADVPEPPVMLLGLTGVFMMAAAARGRGRAKQT